MEADERTLINEAQKDPGNFARLYERNFHRVYAFIASRVRNRDEAEDLTSDVFHKALANIKQFEWRGVPFAAWLLKIAANTMADRMESFAREQGNPIQQEPYVSLEYIEGHARLYRMVDKLPQDQRHVIVKRFVEQKTIREVAKDLQRTEGAIKQLQIRALKNLRTRMGETNG
jgi:RNA polymerase sigma-70 factor, ECF subfamily